MLAPAYILSHLATLSKENSAKEKELADFFTRIMKVDQGNEGAQILFDEKFLSEEFKSHYYNERQKDRKLFNNPQE